ncbi:MAG: hypothetical protein ACOYNI_08840 [Acidimicrobiia bacterium]
MAGLEIVEILEVDGEEFVVYGTYTNDTPKDEFEFFDVYVVNPETGLSELVDLGQPFSECPTTEEIETLARALFAARAETTPRRAQVAS